MSGKQREGLIIFDEITALTPWESWKLTVNWNMYGGYQWGADSIEKIRRSAFKLDPLLYGRTDEKERELNYHFGSALHHVKHPLAKEYHSMTQAGKSKTRRDYAKKGRSKHPHMVKHHAAWKAYVALVTAASLGDS